jgi:hypothetical protein
MITVGEVSDPEDGFKATTSRVVSEIGVARRLPQSVLVQGPYTRCANGRQLDYRPSKRSTAAPISASRISDSPTRIASIPSD